MPGITGTALPAEPQAGGETRLGWFLGDLAPAAADRTVRIVYRAHVDDTYAAPATPVVAGNTLVNGVAVYANRTNDLGTPSTIPPAASFDESTPVVFAPTTVTEPALSLDKTVSGAGPSDFRLTQPGDSYTYTVAITNNGNSPAYDVEVSDQPDVELTNVTLTDGAGLRDRRRLDGGRSGHPLADSRPDRPGSHGHPALHGRPGRLGGAHPEPARGRTRPTSTATGACPRPSATANVHDYREYTNVAADTVTLQVNLPQLDVTKTTGASGNPDTANAEVGQAFPWRVVIQNTSAGASALDVDVSDVLPAELDLRRRQCLVCTRRGRRADDHRGADRRHALVVERRRPGARRPDGPDLQRQAHARVGHHPGLRARPTRTSTRARPTPWTRPGPVGAPTGPTRTPTPHGPSC